MKKDNEKALVRAFMILTAMALVITPASAQIGGQRFANVDWDDDDITLEEIALAETTFADPGLLPDSPFYFLKRWGEDFHLALTFNETQRAQLHMERARIRLAEIKSLVDDNKTEQARLISDDFAAEMSRCRNYSWMYNNSIKKSAIMLGIVGNNPQARQFIDDAANRAIDDESMLDHMREMRGHYCAQIITAAKNPETGEIVNFPTTCSVPEGWELMDPIMNENNLGPPIPPFFDDKGGRRMMDDDDNSGSGKGK